MSTQKTSTSLYAALQRAAHADILLVGCDFDGVLAEFGTDPAACRPAPGAMSALRGLLAVRGTRIAIVSGRDLATLATLTGVEPAEPIVLIGSHGAESTIPSVSAGGALGPQDRAVLDELTEAVAALIELHPGARLERKRAAVAIHTRGLPRESAAAALDAALGLGQAHRGVRVRPGKSVVELSVSHADKGSALAALVRQVKASATVYFGDDVTDEDAFRALDVGRGDVTVKVGAGPSDAAYRVSSVTEVVATLEQLLELRRGRPLSRL